jgi:hypothetical protein
MAYEAKPNTGTLFNNEKKNEKQPDYTGTFKDASGKTWRLAAWVKEGQKGKFLSILASEPQLQGGSTKQESNNDLPF